MENISSKLIIRGESVERIYSLYTNKKLIVNRRYQRKLVWTIDEKRSFIDSIIKGFPIPLILLAEKEEKYEIIDGMQRLDTITSFINGAFDIEGKYFDLETMAGTKLLLDNNSLKQNFPKLERDICVKIVQYVFPISSYRDTTEKVVDEIFRRINSNGKKLSKQELRQAGTTGRFSDLVRNISSKIRGDVSVEDILPLNDMKKISLKSANDIGEGINVDDIYWIRQNIIRKAQIRESKDEEIVADIVASILTDFTVGSSSKILDEFYNETSSRKGEIENVLQIKGFEIGNFIKVYDEINKILDISSKNFVSLLFSDEKDKASRYYIVLFLCIYKLMIIENKKIKNYKGLIEAIDKIYDSITLSKGGGNWSAKEKYNAVNSTKGVIEKFFEKNTGSTNVAYESWITELENILTLSKIENTLYDFKQGFYNIKTKQFDTNCFSKVIKTLTAISNIGGNIEGYVIIGISDNENSSKNYEKEYQVKNIKFSNFYINGIDKEAEIEFKNIDDYFGKIIQLIKKEPISDNFKSYLVSNIKMIKYKDDKSILVFKTKAHDMPELYDNNYYIREGNNTEQIPVPQLHLLFNRFSKV